MNIYMMLATACIVLLFSWLGVRFSLHMFQLNSYKFATHAKWIGKNLHTLIPGVLVSVAIIAALILGVNETVYSWIAISLLLIVLSLFNLPKKAKKPLVYTKRAVRLIVTTALIVICSLTCAVLSMNSDIFYVVVASISLVTPFLVLVSNFINKPVETIINRHYINDAKKILKSSNNLLVIGVTGSYGKTSVKYILRTLLQAKYNVLMTPESFNTPMGVVITVRTQLRATHDVFVCEMGARHVGDIKELCDIVEPKLGIITSIGPQHLETFGSIENVQKTKFELARSLDKNGTIFLNGEDANINSYRDNISQASVSYGLSDKCQYYATDISASSRGTTFKVHTPHGEEIFTTKLVGAHNVINIVGAIAISCELGINLSQLKPQVRKLESVPHRLQLIERNGVTIIDDAYNSNPTGSKAAIDALSLFEGYKILVTPGMVELGKKQAELNKAFGSYAAKVCDFVVLVRKKQAQSIYEGLTESAFPADNIYVAENIQEAISQAYAVDSKGNKKVILLENDLPDNF